MMTRGKPKVLQASTYDPRLAEGESVIAYSCLAEELLVVMVQTRYLMLSVW